MSDDIHTQLKAITIGLRTWVTTVRRVADRYVGSTAEYSDCRWASHWSSDYHHRRRRRQQYRQRTSFNKVGRRRRGVVFYTVIQQHTGRRTDRRFSVVKNNLMRRQNKRDDCASHLLLLLRHAVYWCHQRVCPWLCRRMSFWSLLTDEGLMTNSSINQSIKLFLVA